MRFENPSLRREIFSPIKHQSGENVLLQPAKLSYDEREAGISTSELFIYTTRKVEEGKVEKKKVYLKFEAMSFDRLN